ncbi:MAG: acetylglutamate kinase [Gaiellaceae bacterium]|jgi:acetylglutamate kinase|nr:acetylglutamate kinase [Gaiellaceae bacterium]
MSRVVVKCGGAVFREVAAEILALAEAGDAVCVVHGAGPQITEEMRRRGLEVEFVAGRRVTTAAALEVVRESFAAVGAELCSAIGPRAVGLMGDELGLEATHVPELGLVGEAVPSSPAALVRLLEEGRIPVVAPLARGPLNVNGDEAAAALAVGLGAERLLFFTDVAGVLVEGRVVGALAVDEAERLLDSGAFEGGIVPKLRAAVLAARAGVAASIGETTVA